MIVRPRRLTLLLTAQLLAAVVLSALAGCRFSFRTAEVREFPDDFYGYAIIIWSIPGYAPLPLRNGQLVESFAAGRVIITSTSPHYGYAWDENYFVHPGGAKSPIVKADLFAATGSAQGSSNSIFYTKFFIRTGSDTAIGSTALRDSEEKIRELLEALPRAQ